MVEPTSSRAATTLSYEVVDVFAEHAYAGNPLAVVFDADELDTAQLQAVAREFHLSETAFVLAPDADADYRVRIFTPVTELPFAGHPSVGTAVTLARRGRVGAGTVVQQCGAGLLPIEVEPARGRARLTGGEPTVSAPLEAEPLLTAAGLTAADYVGPAPRHAGAGLIHTYLAVTDEAVRRAQPDHAAASTAALSHLTVFSFDGKQRHAHLRMFGFDLGVPEDPATGSSALGLGVWLVASGLAPGSGTTAYTIAQGGEIGRPSALDCTVDAEDGHAVRTTVAGEVVPIARGEIVVPEQHPVRHADSPPSTTSVAPVT